MNIASVLSNEPVETANQTQQRLDGSEQQSQPPHNPHQYPTRHSMSMNYQSTNDGHNLASLENMSGLLDSNMSLGRGIASPASRSPKSVAFELLLDDSQKTRARIPMRVNIFPHDTTDSIVTTVKNFYGLYEGASTGVSFEDENGNTLIARYENLRNNMTVFVKVIVGNPYGHDTYAQSPYYGMSPIEPSRRPSLGDPIQMISQYGGHLIDHNQPPSRPTSRVTRKRSLSPHTNRGRRSASLNKAQSRSDFKSRASSTHGSFADGNSDAMNGYSDSDGGHGSVTSSRKARSEMTSADISLGNILQEGRRKRAKFESSELPLFAPPQVPLNISASSISPQRQSIGHEGPSPFARPAHRLSYQPLPPSPYSRGPLDQSYGSNGMQVAPYAPPPAPQHGHRLRDRPNTTMIPQFPYGGAVGLNNQRILPTPDPTIASCISDEDVALQLMRLGDASNLSHGRTSASTLNDDAFSGAADRASSTGATSEIDGQTDNDEADHPEKKKFPSRDELRSYNDSDASGDEVDGYEDPDDIKEVASDEFDEYSATSGRPRSKKAKTKHNATTNSTSRIGISASSIKSGKVGKQRSTSTSKKPKHIVTSTSNAKIPILPVSTPSQSRKTSTASTLNFQHQLGVDEEDLSSKPRCRRCRKSKKGCDRQRPCQRCKDAGIGIEGCVSEEEENGRKGRYGRHMGVSVKKSESEVDTDDFQNAGAILTGMALPQLQATAEKSKKRKR